jgi:hypothetical protein
MCVSLFNCTPKKQNDKTIDSSEISIVDDKNDDDDDDDRNDYFGSGQEVVFKKYEISGKYYGSFHGNAPYATSHFVFNENRYEANIFFDDDEIPLRIDKNEVIYDNGGWKYVEKGKFQLEINNGIYFIEWEDSKLFDTYGIIFNEVEMILYHNNDVIFWPGVLSNMANIFPYIPDIKATSEFKSQEYNAKNMLSYKTLPWIGSAKNYGIEETISIVIEQTAIQQEIIYPFTGFIISNGYVDFIHHDFYLKHPRIKTIEIIAPTGIAKEYILEDTSLFQTIILPENMLPKERIENEFETIKSEYKVIVKDIYKGNSRKEACLNIIDVIVPYLRE